MKVFIILVAATLNSFSFAATPAGWTVVSETQNCPQTIQIKAKAGEKYVVVVNGKTEEKLFAKDGSGFNQENMNAIEYAGKTYKFIRPSYVESNTAKLEMTQNGSTTRCPLLNK
jgi:hypothetical protein